MPTISKRLANASPKAHEKARILAEETKPESYVYKGVVITIQDHQYENGLLKVIANATRNGEHVPVENPLYFSNPPVSVPDGTKRSVEFEGQMVEMDNFKEAPLEALKEIVGQTIFLFVK